MNSPQHCSTILHQFYDWILLERQVVEVNEESTSAELSHGKRAMLRHLRRLQLQKTELLQAIHNEEIERPSNKEQKESTLLSPSGPPIIIMNSCATNMFDGLMQACRVACADDGEWYSYFQGGITGEEVENMSEGKQNSEEANKKSCLLGVGTDGNQDLGGKKKNGKEEVQLLFGQQQMQQAPPSPVLGMDIWLEQKAVKLFLKFLRGWKETQQEEEEEEEQKRKTENSANESATARLSFFHLLKEHSKIFCRVNKEKVEGMPSSSSATSGLTLTYVKKDDPSGSAAASVYVVTAPQHHPHKERESDPPDLMLSVVHSSNSKNNSMIGNNGKTLIQEEKDKTCCNVENHTPLSPHEDDDDDDEQEANDSGKLVFNHSFPYPFTPFLIVPGESMFYQDTIQHYSELGRCLKVWAHEEEEKSCDASGIKKFKNQTQQKERENQAPPHGDDYEQLLDSETLLLLCFLYEYFIVTKEHSHWEAILSSCPKSFESCIPTYWNLEQLMELDGCTSLLEEIENKKEGLKKFTQQVHAFFSYFLISGKTEERDENVKLMKEEEENFSVLSEEKRQEVRQFFQSMIVEKKEEEGKSKQATNSCSISTSSVLRTLLGGCFTEKHLHWARAIFDSRALQLNFSPVATNAAVDIAEETRQQGEEEMAPWHHHKNHKHHFVASTHPPHIQLALVPVVEMINHSAEQSHVLSRRILPKQEIFKKMRREDGEGGKEVGCTHTTKNKQKNEDADACISVSYGTLHQHRGDNGEGKNICRCQENEIDGGGGKEGALLKPSEICLVLESSTAFNMPSRGGPLQKGGVTESNEENEEVVMLYGPLQNWELLLSYGFVLSKLQHPKEGEAQQEKFLKLISNSPDTEDGGIRGDFLENWRSHIGNPYDRLPFPLDISGEFSSSATTITEQNNEKREEGQHLDDEEETKFYHPWRQRIMNKYHCFPPSSLELWIPSQGVPPPTLLAILRLLLAEAEDYPFLETHGPYYDKESLLFPPSILQLEIKVTETIQSVMAQVLGIFPTSVVEDAREVFTNGDEEEEGQKAKMRKKAKSRRSRMLSIQLRFELKMIGHRALFWCRKRIQALEEIIGQLQ